MSQTKFPRLNAMGLCQILTDFHNFYTAGKRMKFATKPIQHYLPHLNHVATLPWVIKNSNFLHIPSGAKTPELCVTIMVNILYRERFIFADLESSVSCYLFINVSDITNDVIECRLMTYGNLKFELGYVKCICTLD